jgi:hypothetical protein
MSDETRAYYVDRVSRCAVTILVYASSAREAEAAARRGEGLELGAEYQARGYTRARRAHGEDQ